MPTIHRFTLARNEKLKSRRLIQRLFSEGKSFSVFPLRVIYMEQTGDLPALQAAFTVSSRYCKKAVDRNRVKRLMRESYRLQKNSLAKALDRGNRHLSVFFIHTSAELPRFEEMFNRMGVALARLESSLPAPE